MNDGQVDKLKYVDRVIIIEKGLEATSKRMEGKNVAVFFHKKKKYKGSEYPYSNIGGLHLIKRS